MRTDSGNVYPKNTQNPGPSASWPAVSSELMHCLWGLGMVLGLLTVARCTRSVSYVGIVFAHGAMFAQLWWPMARADAQKRDLRTLGLTDENIVQEIRWGLGMAAIALPGWACAVWGWQWYGSQWMGAEPLPRTAYVSWLGLAPLAFTHILGVALPEELFWRGYVQPVLQHLGAIYAAAWWGTGVTCLLFGLGHVVGGDSAIGLSTLLPALGFAWLRNRRGSIVGAITLHAICNVFSAWLLARV